MNAEGNLEIGLQIQQKFEFYFIALIFTLLGLSVQTATFGHNIYANLFEIIGWLSFLISGLFGLSRLEWAPVQYRLFSKSSTIETEIREAQKAKLEGHHELFNISNNRAVNTDDYINKRIEANKKIKEKTDQIDNKTKFKYSVQKISFITGLIFVIASRSLEPIVNIINTLI